MDKYDRAFAKHQQRKRKQRKALIICNCSLAIGYLLGNLSCLVLVMYFGR